MALGQDGTREEVIVAAAQRQELSVAEVQFSPVQGLLLLNPELTEPSATVD